MGDARFQLFPAGVSFFRCLYPPDPEAEEDEGNGKEREFERSTASIGREAEEFFEEIHRHTSEWGPKNSGSLNSLGDGGVVVFRALLLQLVLDLAPNGITGLVGWFEEAFGVLGDGLEVANEGGTDGIVFEEGLEAGVGRDVSVAIGEEVWQIFFKVGRSHGVEVGKAFTAHTATSLMPVGSVDGSGWRRSSRSLRRALWSWDLLFPVEHSSMVAISLCSKPSTSCRTKTMR